MQNPYDPNKQEASHHTWAHGFNSLNEDENPYSEQNEPNLATIWSQGFRANKGRAKPKAPPKAENTQSGTVEPQIGVTLVSTPNTASVSLKDVSTEVLLAEVLSRVREVDKVMEQMRRLFK